ncbi:hypothetical protein AB5J72_33340 [Streptomyces sp. CG1]
MTGLLSVIAVVVLALTGHSGASLIAGTAGGALRNQVTLIIRR